MIQKNIFQTYKCKFEDLSPRIKEVAESWRKVNPLWDYRYFDDEQVEKFILEKFGSEWMEIYKTLPLGAMRADLWRYMVIFECGGVYADIDTLCLAPIEKMIMENFDMIVIPQSMRTFAQWFFAASKGHPFLGYIISLAKQRIIRPNYSKSDFVDSTTGVNVWTEGIKNGLGTVKSCRVNIMLETDYYNRLKGAKENGFYCYGKGYTNLFDGVVIKHLYASQNWKEDGYESWTKAKETVVNEHRVSRM